MDDANMLIQNLDYRSVGTVRSMKFYYVEPLNRIRVSSVYRQLEINVPFFHQIV